MKKKFFFKNVKNIEDSLLIDIICVTGKRQLTVSQDDGGWEKIPVS